MNEDSVYGFEFPNVEMCTIIVISVGYFMFAPLLSEIEGKNSLNNGKLS